ncbi:hypothetical protein X975_01546, partial [Stegodyphus mimosarum]
MDWEPVMDMDWEWIRRCTSPCWNSCRSRSLLFQNCHQPHRSCRNCCCSHCCSCCPIRSCWTWNRRCSSSFWKRTDR